MRTKRAKVLIVNRDIKYFQTIEDVLKNDASVTILDNPQLVESEIKSEEYSAIITDSGYDSTCGFKILDLVNKWSPETIKIIMSDNVKTDEILEAINNYQVFKFLHKSISTIKLHLAVKEALIAYKIKKEFIHFNENDIRNFLYVPFDILHNLRLDLFNFSIQIGRYAKNHKHELPIKDFWSFEVTCLMMFTGSLFTDFTDINEVYKTENLVKVLRHSAKITNAIPLLEVTSKSLLELAKLYEHKQKVINLYRDSETLKILLDYFILKKNKNFYQEITKLYTVELVKFIIDISNSRTDTSRIVSVNELEIGMVALEDFKTLSGSVVVKKGELITQSNLTAILQLESKNRIKTIYKIQG